MKYLLYTRLSSCEACAIVQTTGLLWPAAPYTAIQWSLWTAVYRNTDAIAGVSLATMMSLCVDGKSHGGFLASLEPQAGTEGETGHNST